MAFWEKVEVIEGVEIVLKSLYHKYLLCVATNANYSDTALMEKALIRGSIHQYFRFFFSSKDLGYEKPDHLFFLKIAGILKLKPAECLVVGNDYGKDIEGAYNAGMKGIHFLESQEPAINSIADFSVSHWKDLPILIEKISVIG
jgi:putative hydrolase of the HAD superfamily